MVLKMLMLFSICEKAFGRIGKKIEKNKLPKGGKDSGVECDTKTPGCETMCIDSFFPISPTSFWQLEIIVIALPMIIFTTYVSHVQGQQLRVLDKKQCKEALMENHVEEENEIKFYKAYILMNVCRTLFGGLMLLAYFQIYIFKMEVPESYVCDRAPCQQLT